MFYGNASVEYRTRKGTARLQSFQDWPCPEALPIETSDIRQLRKLYSPSNNLPTRFLFGPQQQKSG